MCVCDNSEFVVPVRTYLQCRPQCMSSIHLLPFLTHTAVVDNDYVAVSGQLIQFNAGDVIQMHTIDIIDDDECEKDPNETFFSDITLDSPSHSCCVSLVPKLCKSG